MEEVVPFFGVPEALLTDRGTNLLSYLMKDLCEMLGMAKLNTTAYHPECDGMVERFNRTLKAMLRKHAARFGKQWDQYLSSVLWAYRNTVHESTGEKPSFLLFGLDLRSPTEAAFMKPTDPIPSNIEDYCKEVMLSLSSARELAVQSVQKAQKRYKKFYDRKAEQVDYRVGDWIFIRFPAEESGRGRKLSHPWHGPYRIISKRDPDVTAVKVYFPGEGSIQVHQQRVTRCPTELVTGYYWYGPKKHCTGGAPKWVIDLQKQADTQKGQSDLADHNDEEDAQKSVSHKENECNDEDTHRDNHEEFEVSESTGRQADQGVTLRQRSSLRKKTNIPRRYQQ